MLKKSMKNRTKPYQFPKKLSLLTCSLLLPYSLLYHPASHAAELWEMSLEDLGKMRVTTLASGTLTPLDKAAGIATVITDDDIATMGATDIDQVLETVPGLHVGRGDQILAPKFFIRGITSNYNAQTLMLINGIPISSLFSGNRSLVWMGMPVKSIARIEVIRGPGSALYGADAFAGVINIITKTSRDMTGTKIGGQIGSFDTKSAWVEHGGTYGGYEVGFVLEAQTTDGARRTVQADHQTALDDLFINKLGIPVAPISLAPGKANTQKDMVDARLDIAHDNSRLRIGYQGRFNLGTGIGTAQALDPEGGLSSNRYNLDYTYTKDDLSPDWGLVARTSYYRGTQVVTKNQILFPAGAMAGAFPDGFIGNPEFQEENARFDLSTLYKGFDTHRIRLGTGFYWGDIFEVKESKNFALVLVNTPVGEQYTFVPRPSGMIEDVTDTSEAFVPEKERTNSYVFIQDEWKLADKWQLTTGVRHDHYSDFGNTTNPRLALVWSTSDTMTTKLLYGKAFRAPALIESGANSNPVALGNPDLKPEKIDTYELAFSHHVSTDLLYTTNIFYYKLKDFIDFVAVGTSGVKQAQNIGRSKGHGLELEIDYSPTDALRLLTNFSYQKATDQNTKTDVGGAPNYEVYGRSEWNFAPNWQFDSQVTWVGEQKRAAGDDRPALDAYTTVDLTLRKKQVWKSMALAVSVQNVFDEDVREPSPGPVAPLTVPALPYDLPMPGRSIYGEISYTF